MEHPWPTEASVHHESLQLLREVTEYLGRLPLNPLTLRLMKKIDEHLERPGAQTHRRRIEQSAKDQDWCARLQAGECFTGIDRYTPEGLPVVDCLVLNSQLHLRSPALSHVESPDAAKQMAYSLGRDLVNGIDIKLTLVKPSTSRFVAKNWPNHLHQFS